MRIGIRGGRILDPLSNAEKKADILIEDGKIAAVGEPLEEGCCDRILEAEGLAVAPGFVDVHVHFRDPGLTYKEDILTGAKASAAGGYTTVICMANTKPVIDNPETLKLVLDKGKQTDIHVLSCAAVTKGMQGKELTDMEGLRRLGAAGFTDDGKPILDEELLLAAMEEAVRLNVPISLHEEDPKYIADNGVNRGIISEKLGIGGSPAEAEITMVERDCLLAEKTGVKLNIQHISTAGAVEAVRRSKQRGSHVTAEAAPHHFTLTEGCGIKLWNAGKDESASADGERQTGRDRRTAGWNHRYDSHRSCAPQRGRKGFAADGSSQWNHRSGDGSRPWHYPACEARIPEPAAAYGEDEPESCPPLRSSLCGNCGRGSCRSGAVR